MVGWWWGGRGGGGGDGGDIDTRTDGDGDFLSLLDFVDADSVGRQTRFALQHLCACARCSLRLNITVLEYESTAES